MLIFARGGISERWLIDVCDKLDCPIVSREDVAEAYELWLSHLFGPKAVSRPRKKKVVSA